METRKYVWGLGLAYAVESSGNVLVYHTDGLGSVRALSDGAGLVVQAYGYDEYGMALVSEGGVEQPFRYTREQYDDSTGLVYLRARYYDPESGQFVTRDDFGGNIVQPTSLHRYSYVTNRPTIFSDPSGRCGPARVAVAIMVGSGEGAAAVEALAVLGTASYVYRDQISQGLQAIADSIAATRLLDENGNVIVDSEEHARLLREAIAHTGTPQNDPPEPPKEPEWGPTWQEKVAYIGYNLARLFGAGDNAGFWSAAVSPDASELGAGPVPSTGVPTSPPPRDGRK